MEYFGFASGSSKTGPIFPYMQESILNNYPSTLLEHPVVPTAVGILNTYIHTPDTKNLITVVQTWADKSLELLDKHTVQALGIGLSASICAYGAWRIRKRWKNNNATGKIDRFPALDSAEPNVKNSFYDERLHTLGSLELSESSTDITQRQLWHTQAKLNDLRYQLKRLEGEKDLLAAEVSMRKKIVAQLQGEIHVERDKRRQAELKMEMMEWENTHLRRLRKEVAVKEGKIDMLEACLKEKDEIHDKLFQENVILPKNVAEARTKEYEILHTKVQKYEMEAVMKRNSEDPYKPSRHDSVTSATGQTLYDDTTAAISAAIQSQRQPEYGTSESYLISEWEKSPSSTGSILPPMMYATSLIDRTKTLIYSSTNWSNSTDKTYEQAKPGEDVCKRDGLIRHDNRKKIQMEAMCKKLAPHLEQQNARQSSNAKGLVATSSTYSEYSSHPLYNTEDDPGVLGQFKTFLDGFPHSKSESGQTTTPPVTPVHIADLLTSQSRIWGRSLKDEANNRCQENEEDDNCCPSVSDGQSSIFMSASCGSGPSDDDIRSRSLNDSYSRGHSLKRIATSSKSKSFMRNLSPAKGLLLKCATPKVRSKSRVKELHSEDTLLSKLISTSEKDSLPSCNDRESNLFDNKAPATEIETDGQKSSYRQSRARQRGRLRKSRSKLTTNFFSSQCTESPFKVQNSDGQAPLSERRLSENCLAMPTSQAPVDHANQSPSNLTNFNSYKKFTHPQQIPLARSEYQAVSKMVDANKNSKKTTDTDSEESWIVITPAI